MPRRLALLLALSVLLAGCSGGDGDAKERRAQEQARADAYVASVVQWRTDRLDPAVTAVGKATFSELVTRRETAALRARQKARCQAIGAARTAVAALVAPEVAGPMTPAATALSADLLDQTNRYRDLVTRELGEVLTYCRSYARLLDLNARADAARKALDAATFRGAGCRTPVGCIPGPRGLPAYLEALKLDRVDLLRERLSVLTDPCPLTDLAPVCAFNRAEGATTLKVSRDVYDAVARGSGVAEANAAFVRQDKRFQAGLQAVYADAFPTFDPARVAGNELFLLGAHEQNATSALVPATTLPTSSPSPS